MNFILNTDATTLSPIALFVQADWVVKAIMTLLLLASIWSWAIIVSLAGRIGRARRQGDEFEREFWAATDVDGFYRKHSGDDVPSARIFAAGMAEWRESVSGERIDPAGTRDRLATSLGGAVAIEVDRLSDRLNILATVGSVAPFVGLFGTVWGIMRSFTGIAQAQSTSLAVVAPGIAEALFATAIGLFAAIPAVVAYNRLSHGINRVEARLMRFADRFHSTLSRELDAVPAGKMH